MTTGTPWWVAPALLFAAALLQSSLFPALGLIAVRPDLVLIMVVVWAVLRGVNEALPWGFIGGVMLDLLSGGPFGTAMLVLVIVAFCSSVGEISLFRSSLMLPMLTVFWATILYNAIFLFLLRTHHYPVDWLGTLRQVVVPNAMLNAAVCPLVYWVLSRIERRTRTTLAVEW